METREYLKIEQMLLPNQHLIKRFSSGSYLDFKFWDLNTVLNSMDSYQIYLVENIPSFLIFIDPRFMITLAVLSLLIIYNFNMFSNFPKTRRAARLGLSYFVFIKIALEVILVLSLFIFPKLFFLSSLMSFGNHVLLILTIPADILALGLIGTMKNKDVVTKKSIFTNKISAYSHLTASPAYIACTTVDKILFLAQKSTSYVNYAFLIYSVGLIFLKPLAYYTGMSGILDPFINSFILGFNRMFGTGRDPKFLFFAHKLFPYHPVNLAISFLLLTLNVLGISTNFFLFGPLVTIAYEFANVGFMKLLRVALRKLAIGFDRVVKN